MPENLRDIGHTQLKWFWFLLVGIIVLCHFDWLVLGREIQGADIASYYMPLYEEYLRQIAHGHYPLWTNVIFSGHPAVAEGQLSLLHPLMYFLLHTAGHRADAAFVALHALLAAGGMWVYCRSIGASRFASILCALAIGASGHFAVRVIQPNYAAALAYLPWQLWLTERLCARCAPLYWAALLALVSGLQWLCGHPQIPVFAGYLVGFYCFLRVIPSVGGEEETARNWIALPKVAGALFAGLLLAAIQLAPLVFDVVRVQSERAGGVGFAFSSFGSLPPQALLLPFFPALYGPSDLATDHPWWPSLTGGKVSSFEAHMYVGAALMLLSILCLWKRRESPRVRALALPAILCVLYAPGKFSPLYWVMHYLPGLNMLRVPSRALAPVIVFALPLAALALDWLARAGEEGVRAWSRLLRIAVVVGLAFWFALGIGTRVFGPALLEKGVAKSLTVEQAKLAQRDNVHPATRERRLRYAKERPTLALAEMEQATAIGPLALTNFGFLAIVGLMIGVWARASGSEKVARYSLVLFMLCGAELLWFNREFGVRGAQAQDQFAPPAYKNDLPPGKFFSAVSSREVLDLDWDGLRRRSPALASVIWDLPTPDGRTSMQPADYVAMLEPIRGYDRAGAERLELLSAALPKLRLLGTGSALTLREWGALDMPLLYQDFDVNVWRLPEPSPQAFVLNRDDVDDTSMWRELLMQEHPDARALALYDAVLSGQVGTVSIADEGDPDRAELRVDSPTGGWLVRIVRNMPGWRAFVGGKEVPITGALGFFQGVRVPAGRSQVEFRYEPPSFYWGSRISTGAALALLVLLGLSLYRARRQNP